MEFKTPSNLRCPRNGKWTDFFPFVSSHWMFHTIWEGDTNRATSPDTGQRRELV